MDKASAAKAILESGVLEEAIQEQQAKVVQMLIDAVRVGNHEIEEARNDIRALQGLRGKLRAYVRSDDDDGSAGESADG